MRVAIYLRISSDPTDQKLGVARQAEDCTAEAERRGWGVAEVLEDNDLSAFEGKYRPGYQRLLHLVETRAVGAVIAWQGDRLHRSVEEYLDFAKAARKSKVQVVLVRGGEWALDTAAGRFSSAMLAMVAEHESDLKRERVNRALRQRAERGLPANTRFRPYGYEPDGITLREDEAQLIREGVAAVLAGQPLAPVARRMGKTPTGAKKVLRSPRIAGLREFQGETFPAAWPAIITPEQHEAVCNLFARDGRAFGPARHLLSGYVRCGTCGVALRPALCRGRFYYRCMNRGCTKKVQRAADRLEAYVARKLLYAVTMEERTPFLASQENRAAQAKIDALQRRLGEIEAALAEDEDASVDMLSRAVRRIEAQIAELQAQVIYAPALGGLLPGDEEGWRKVQTPWEAWWADERVTLVDRRALLARHVAAVTVFPTAHGRLPLDESAVRIDWRGAE